ncbi:MAG: bifunctional hydroxymethylpyrimidine kinase/phosphomethylpyrimidine kinase [Myxococcales bacterium]|nr:bifunctional hydroxymethylpyrimidine kinase/phosphomethylpyrimidine kinase [Myxococcales bacterium]
MSDPSTLWLLAGCDPTGGAGLWRDLATARACAPELLLAGVVTAWTRQGGGIPATSAARSADHVCADLRALAAPAAVKLGLLPSGSSAQILAAVAATGAPVVVDPVLAASDGGDLGARADALVDVLRDMSRETWLITPNRAEAAALAGTDADDPTVLVRLAARLGSAAILLKNGPGAPEGRVHDLLWHAGQVLQLSRPRDPGPDPRGTGCALATAIACGLARGRTLPQAVASAVAWLDVVRAWTHPGPDGRPHLPDAGPPLPA